MAWLKRLFGLASGTKLIGTDLAGNQYFERIVRGKLLICLQV